MLLFQGEGAVHSYDWNFTLKCVVRMQHMSDKVLAFCYDKDFFFLYFTMEVQSF